MKKLPCQIDLRNPHRIYQEGKTYFVTGESPNGQRYERRVSSRAVDYLRSSLRGQQATAQDAAGILASVAQNLGLTYTYGRKLQFSAQDVLLVLVALGEANVTKEGRSYVYRIRA